MVSSGLGSKPAATVSTGLTSKTAVTVFQFVHQNRWLRFDDLGIKITATVLWFGSQNHAAYSLSVASQNRWEGDSASGTRRDLAACFA
jgi:hypothetical protein